MILDNLFTMLGGTGTAAVLFGIVAMVGFVPMSSVICPMSQLSQRIAKGR